MFKHDVCLLVVIPERQKLAGLLGNGSGLLAKVKSKEQVHGPSASSVSAMENRFYVRLCYRLNLRGHVRCGLDPLAMSGMTIGDKNKGLYPVPIGQWPF